MTVSPPTSGGGRAGQASGWEGGRERDKGADAGEGVVWLDGGLGRGIRGGL